MFWKWETCPGSSLLLFWNGGEGQQKAGASCGESLMVAGTTYQKWTMCGLM